MLTRIDQDLATFRARFAFDKTKVGLVGVERECFIVDNAGVIVPESVRVLRALKRLGVANRFCYELSACQVESHAGPCKIDDLEQELATGDSLLDSALKKLGLRSSHDEVAPATMPLDVFPDPTGRYQDITSKMPRDVLLAACRVIGTHVHVGMPDHEAALRAYNRVVAHCESLSQLGDRSNGERLAIYRIVKKDCVPQPYVDWTAFHQFAIASGFNIDLRSCWTLIRISKHGTIEARMFGATTSISQVTHWARTFHTLCMESID